jgi:hypothetical protein
MRRWITPLAAALLALPAIAQSQIDLPRRVYVVPGVHYGTPARASVALTAFLDERGGVVGKGNMLIVEGGRDAFKAQLGIANVAASLGYSAQIGFMRTHQKPIGAIPNASYAGTEFHLYIKVLNLGTGFYAPVGSPKGKRGLLHLSAGLGF